MNNDSTPQAQALDDYDLRDEYDLTQLPVVARGRYAVKERVGTHVRVLAPDVVQAFPTDDAVNAALLLALQLAQIPQAAD